MKPLSSCALFGAVRALGGIKDALILQHSVVGCQWGSLKMLLMAARRSCARLCRKRSVFLRIAVRYL